METKELKVGDYIKGFKHNTADCMIDRMNSHIGKIGKIIQKHEDTVKVEFEDGLTWHYPNYKAIEHLVDPLEDTPFHKPDFSHLLDKINPSHYKSKPKETIERIGDNLSLQDPKLFSILLSKDKDRRIVIDQTKEQIDLLVDASKGWHVIVIEQQQDKGIQIIIKS